MSTTFLRQKSTGIKFLKLDNGRMIPVSQLPTLCATDPALRAVQVRCDSCESWSYAPTMHPTATGAACHACHTSGRTSTAPAPSTAETRAAAMEKVAKLLRLAQSDNPHEAALAASRAQEIIDRYRLTMDTATMSAEDRAQDAEPIQNFERDPLTTETTLQRWKSTLAVRLAKLNQCKVFLSSSRLCLIGGATDVSTVRYLFNYLTAEIDRLAARHCKGTGRSYWNNFRHGAAETVTQRLAEAQTASFDAIKTEAAAASPSALVIVQNNLATLEKKARSVELWAAQNMNLGKARSSSRSQFNHSAREAGRSAGRSINLAGNSAQLRAGSPHALR